MAIAFDAMKSSINESYFRDSRIMEREYQKYLRSKYIGGGNGQPPKEPEPNPVLLLLKEV